MEGIYNNNGQLVKPVLVSTCRARLFLFRHQFLPGSEVRLHIGYTSAARVKYLFQQIYHLELKQYQPFQYVFLNLLCVKFSRLEIDLA